MVRFHDFYQMQLMKKLLLIFVGTILVAGGAAAQDYQKHIFGVRAGLNISNISVDGVSPQSKAGFHVGGVYQRLLTEAYPLYLETGLYLTQKGARVSDGIAKFRPMYLQVPVMVNWKFDVGHDIVLVPAAGLYYALGICGKVRVTDMDYDETEKGDIFGEEGIFKRSDLGIRVGGSIDWKRYSFGLGYEFGLLNVGKDTGDMSVRNGCFTLTVGYRF